MSEPQSANTGCTCVGPKAAGEKRGYSPFKTTLSNANPNCACLAGTKDVYRPDFWKPASEIGINGLRQIMLLPLTFSRETYRNHQTLKGMVRQTLETLKADEAWEHVPDLEDHTGSIDFSYGDDRYGKARTKGADEANLKADHQLLDDIMRYGEQFYFHDFIQENFFAKDAAADGSAAITLFRRKADRLAMTVNHKGRTFLARIDRINLYVFASGAIMLALEVDFTVHPRADLRSVENPVPPSEITLADAQDLCDLARRIYSPFFASDGYEPAGKHDTERAKIWLPRYPQAIDIVEIGVAEEDKSFPPDGFVEEDVSAFGTAYRRLRDRNAPPIANHIRALLHPLIVSGTPEADAWFKNKDRHKPPLLRQVVDERMPLMSYVELAEVPGKAEAGRFDGGWDGVQRALYQVSRGDFARLCYADLQGSDPLPYSAHFMGSFEKDTCYDRYFPHASSSVATSRIMTCGYHFVLIGSGWFTRNLLQHHFRRHYFQMGLALHAEVASLLTTSSRITEAVNALNKGHTNGEDGSGRQWLFHQEMERIEEDFLKSVHLFHFTDMSNQVQPQEMLALWKKHLHTDTMFDDVKSEIETAVNFLNSTEQGQLARDAHVQTQKATQLNRIATIGLVLSLAFAFLSMHLFFGDGSRPMNLFNPAEWFNLSTTVGAFALAAATMIGLTSWRRTRSGHNHPGSAPHDPGGMDMVLIFLLLGLLVICLFIILASGVSAPLF